MSTTVLDLNDDCLWEILKHLPVLADQVQLSRTCRRFRTLIEHAWHLRWKDGGALNLNDLDLAPEQLSYFVGAIRNVVQSIAARHKLFAGYEEEEPMTRDLHFWSAIKACPNLRELQLYGILLVRHGQSPNMCLPQLQTLDLEGCHLTDDAAKAILANLGLKRLSLANVNRHRPEADRMVVSFAGAQFAQLEELKISQHTACNSFRDIFRLRRLKVLTVSDNEDDDTFSKVHLDNDIIRRIIDIFGNRLHYFEMHHFFAFQLTEQICRMSALNILNFRYTPFSELRKIATAMTELREISLIGCSDFMPADLLRFVRNCRNLAVLDVRCCAALTNEITEDLIWQTGRILLARNSGIRLKIIISQSSLCSEIVRHPDFIRLQSVLEIADKYTRIAPFRTYPYEFPKYLTFKFLECSDKEYDLLCRKLDEVI